MSDKPIRVSEEQYQRLKEIKNEFDASNPSFKDVISKLLKVYDE